MTAQPSSILFSSETSNLGKMELRYLDLEKDIPILHTWVTKEYAKFWGMQSKNPEELKAEYIRLTTPEHANAFIGEYNGKPVFLFECYHPKYDLIGQYYDAQETDRGIHVIIAPCDEPIHLFTWTIFSTILDFVFSQDDVERILVEPDIRNDKMFTICHKVGFINDKVVTLPHKTAKLAFCTRNNYIATKNRTLRKIHTTMKSTKDHIVINGQQSIAHLSPEIWEKANRQLIKKAITEFSHEQLIQPKQLEQKENFIQYKLISDEESIYYTFKGKLLALNHLSLDVSSIKKYLNNKEERLDAVLFIKEFKKQLAITPAILASYLEEIISTLHSSAFKLLKENLTSKELVCADFQTIEQSMTEGHPGFVANNGRIGFDSDEYRRYAPEVGNHFSMLWLAGHKDRMIYAGTDDLPYDVLIRKELGTETIESFNKLIKDKGAKPADYLFIPVHPWQWFNKLASVFATEIASGHLIFLGNSPDHYQAQQSIRTLFNVTHPEKFYIKTALSILNMGFMRGLPVYYLGTAPEMAVWLNNLLDDAYLKETGFSMLGEIASISYINPYFEEFGKHNAYNKMLASLWRESPVPNTKPNQQLMTMAAFLHVDREGTALLPELIKASGLSPDKWLTHYFKAYLSPLIHCFYTYDLVFMPHGENLILVLENHIPVKVFMKDITEEVTILNPDIKLPENIQRIYGEVPDHIKLLSIFIDVFDGFFRFMSQILVDHMSQPEEVFWKQVAECIHEYQERHPHLADKFEYYNLFADEFTLSCLNRLQLRNNTVMVDLDDPAGQLQFYGTLKNPIAAYSKKEVLI